MELRVLQYFLAIAREETILGAAERLHMTQPTLSRQMKELEEDSPRRNLEEGEKVQFEVEQGPKGLQASNVVKL